MTWRHSSLVLLLGFCVAAPAAARELAIKHFDAQITVHPDATMDITEHIQVHFSGAWRGLYRTIPTEYRTPQGLNYRLFLDETRATDEQGDQLRCDFSWEGTGQKFKISVPHATDVTRNITFHYVVEDGLRFFEDHDELYWNITGNEWDVPIEAATARIELPAGVTGIRTVAFTGTTGAREHDADLETTGAVIGLRMRRSMAFHEGVTVAIGWDKGIVQEPGRAARMASS